MKKIIFICLILLFMLVFIVSFINKQNIKSDKHFERPVNIVFICDNNYVTYLRAAIRSIAVNKNPNTRINIYVIGVDLSEKNAEKLINERKKDVTTQVIQISLQDLKNLPGKREKVNTENRADNAKFFLPSLLPDVNKILYLDADIIVLKDLYPIFANNIDNYCVAAVDDWQSDWEDGSGRRYFNNGVMLLNLKKMRENDISEQLIEYKKKTTFHRFNTQDAFNAVMADSVLYLPLFYDTLAPEYDSEYVVLPRIRQVLKDNFDPDIYPYMTGKAYQEDVYIIHYCGWYNDKPWIIFTLDRKSNRIWYKYAPFDFWLEFIKSEFKKLKKMFSMQTSK